MNINKIKRIIKYKNEEIEYMLIYKNVKNINLRVKPIAEIIVSANKNVSIEYIENFIISKYDFIKTALNSYSSNSCVSKDSYECINGETLYFLGVKYKLKIIKSNENFVKLNDTHLELYTSHQSVDKNKNIIELWYKTKQEQIFNQICKDIFILFEMYKIEYPIIKIRKMKTMWGSCRPNIGIITLNAKLIYYPIETIEYVVLHEFAHFIHQNHSKDFYKFIENLMPDWENRKSKLKE